MAGVRLVVSQQKEGIKGALQEQIYVKHLGMRCLMQRETHGRLCKSMFPEKPEDLHLERCVRVLPHHMDTGGFFIAVIQKVADLPANATIVTK